MSAEKILRALCLAHPPLLAEVPAARIAAAAKPVGIPVPYISLRPVSSTEQRTLQAAEAARLTRSRVQITAIAADVPTLKRLLPLIAGACTDRRGTVSGLRVLDTVHAGEGPALDYRDDTLTAAGLHQQALDVMVTWMRPR